MNEVREVVHDVEGRFYELRVGGTFAGLLVYGLEGNRFLFTHTYIAEGYRGQGLSWVLLRGALDDVRARHGTITNYCPVLDRFIDKNPEYATLVDPDNPGSWPKHRD